MPLVIWKKHWLCRLLWIEYSFSQYQFLQSKTWYISPFVCVQFDFFQQYLTVYWVLIFCLIMFILRYFVLFVAMVNGIVSSISLSDLVLLIYRNAKELCQLILSHATLPNPLISSRSFPVVSLGFSMYSVT